MSDKKSDSGNGNKDSSKSTQDGNKTQTTLKTQYLKNSKDINKEQRLDEDKE